MERNDTEINSRINLFFKEIFEKYEELDEENINKLKVYIELIFSSLRPTMFKKAEYKKQLFDYLNTNVYLVGLTMLYSKDKYIQYSFLMKVNSEIEKLLKNNKSKKKIK